MTETNREPTASKLAGLKDLVECEEHYNETVNWQILKARAVAKCRFTPVVKTPDAQSHAIKKDCE